MATEAPLVPDGTRTGTGAGITDDPLIVFNFGLEIDGVLEGYFQDCSGIGSEHDIVESQLVNKNGKSFIFKAPGIIKYNDVTLKRGITADMQIWDWRADVERGDFASIRKNCSIIMYDRNFREVSRWNFYNAWPSKVSGPDLSSSGNDFGVEEVTIVHEGFYREK